VTQAISSRVQSAFYRAFYAWGMKVGTKPKTTIGLSFIVTFLLCLRLLAAFRNPLPEETRQEKLFAPQNSQGVADQERYEATWGMSSRRNVVYFTTQPRGGNILTSSALAEVQRFDAIVRDQLWATQFKNKKDWEPVGNQTYRTLCVKAADGSCQVRGFPLELFYRVDGSYDFNFTDAEIAAIVNSGKGIDPTLFPPDSNRTIAADTVFGGITRDSSGQITGAASVKITYNLINGDLDTLPQLQALAWEEQLDYLVGPDWTVSPPTSVGSATSGISVFSSSVISMYPSTAGAISRELSETISGDVMLLQVGFAAIAIYAFFVMGRPRKPVSSRAVLALAGVVSCGFAIAVSYSVGALFMKVNNVISVLPFILLGIGVDDMFVLVHALEQTPADMPVPKRVATCMGHAGVSITITSLTDLLAFALGSTSSLPGLATFCGFAAIGIAADFILQITFFAGWLALDAYREAKERADCCCLAPVLCAPACATTACCATYPTLQDLNVKYYVPFLRNKVVKVCILLGFAAYTAISAWQASMLQQDFDRRWFVNDDATLQQTFQVEDDYYPTVGVPVTITTPPTATYDYTTVAGQQAVVQLGINVGANRYIQAGSVVAWYPAYRAWVGACSTTANIQAGLPAYCTTTSSGGSEAKRLVGADGTTPVADDAPLDTSYVPKGRFFPWLNQWVQQNALGQQFASSILWVSGNNTLRTEPQAEAGLVATRLRATYVKVETANEEIDTMNSLRDSVYAAGVGDSYPFAFVYIFYEQFAIIVQEAVLNLSLALVASFLVTLIIIASLPAALLVTLCVVLVDVDILGLMNMWDLTIDSVSIIQLVLAVGLSVDYSAHIAHAFVVAKGTRQERADKAVSEMGTAVVHGATSTFLAVCVLGGSKSYIFRVFFKQFFGICLFGAAHGLMFLPVLLSLIGPPPIDIPLKHAIEPPKAEHELHAKEVPEHDATADEAPKQQAISIEPHDMEVTVAPTPPTKSPH